MKKLFLSITAFGLILFCGLTMATAQNTLLAEKALASTIELNMDNDNYGSGFLVDSARVVTNLHVIHGAITGTANLVGQTKSHPIAGYTAIADEHDLVILDVPGLNADTLPLGNSDDVKIGETVYAVGNPRGFEGTFSEGNISGIRTDLNGKLLQMTAPVSPGSSGGPVLNKDGDVIGVSVGGGAQNLNWAIPVNYLKPLMEEETTNIQDLSNAAVRIGILNKYGILDRKWEGQFYPSYKLALINLRRSDAKNIYGLMTFMEGEKIIASDVIKVLKIPAGDTLYVTRQSIYSLETKKSEKINTERLGALARRVFNNNRTYALVM